MILEGLITTVGEGGSVNVSPMGPAVGGDPATLTLRPFRSSQTYRNLKLHGEAVFHVTDDVEMLARAAIADIVPELRPARAVRGWIIAGSCRAFELRVRSWDDSHERAAIVADVLREEALRPHFGFNRAKHAVVEAAILATRVHLLPRDQVLAKLDELLVPVQKTGGEAEARAFALLRAHVEAAPVQRPSCVRVRTGSRLHLGLVWPGRGGPRRFGGAGMMVGEPGVELIAEPAPSLQVEGPLRARVESLARSCGAGVEPAHIRVLNAPREHCGLGAGTQLGMAVASALALLRGEHAGIAVLAARAGRGRRSAIGVHGFERGGFLVDGGKGEATGLAPLLLRLEMPAAWRVLLVSPQASAGLSGAREEASFLELDDRSHAAAEALSHLLVMGLAPALAEADCAAFGEALHEFGRRSGDLFKHAQGGAFASSLVGELVESIRRWGVPGAAQSSWGPTVFAVTAGAAEAEDIAAKVRSRFGDAAGAIQVTHPLNRGASVEAIHS